MDPDWPAVKVGSRKSWTAAWIFQNNNSDDRSAICVCGVKRPEQLSGCDAAENHFSVSVVTNQLGRMYLASSQKVKRDKKKGGVACVVHSPNVYREYSQSSLADLYDSAL